MEAYDVAAWSDLFVACAGAAAALAGLLFVAVSINVERILAYPELPARALQTAVLLLAVIVVSILGLAPATGERAFALQVLAVGVVATLIIGSALIRHPGQAKRLPFRLLAVGPGAVLYIVGGISLLAESGGGLNWVLGAIVAAFIGATANAWVLLIEILR
ncbi:MAG: hypothetical protein AB7V62_06035 [Thermoleophilia bacterium]